MSRLSPGIMLRLLPVLIVCAAAGAAFAAVQGSGPWVLRNLVPLGVLAGLAGLTLVRGGGTWTGAGWRLPLGTLGFAVPALGLSCYLHYAYAVNLDDMFAAGPGELFRWLPVYTGGAGAIGFAIGWIAGRNL